jgi:signal transduction histidine kinase/ligand-binding sensor domain-containing protein
MSRMVRAGLALLLTLAFGVSSVAAQEAAPALRLRDYVITEWTQRDGIPLTGVGAILQTGDGRLWVTTEATGLLRFDGIRFVEDPAPCFRRLNNPYPSGDGGFWGTCGMNRAQNLIHRTPAGKFVEMPHPFARDTRSRFSFVDRRGRLVFVGESIRYLQSPGLESLELPRPTEAPIDNAVDDSDGALWVASPNQVFRVDAGGQHQFTMLNAGCLTPAREGGILASTGDHLWHLRGQSMRAIATAPPGVWFNDSSSQGCMIDAGDAGIWIGTRQHGVARYQNGRVETIGDGNRRLVTEVFLDREGQIWVGTTSGLQRFRKPMVRFAPSAATPATPSFVFVDTEEGLWTSPFERRAIRTAPNGEQQVITPGRNAFAAIGQDSTGRIWLSDRSNIGYADGNRFVAVRDTANTPVSGVWSFRPSRGQLWAVAQGSGVYRVAPGRPELVVKSDAAYDRFLVSEQFGTWISLRGGGIEQHIDGRVNRFRSQAGGEMEDIRTIVEDGDSIWIGTFGGLRRWRGGQWTEWTSAHGLPGTDGAVDEITIDQFGRFWFMTRGGILMLPRDQFDATPDGMPRALLFARIGVLDGVVAHPGSLRHSPRVTRDRRGRLYFTTIDAVAMVDPSEHTASLAPPITLESVSVDNRTVDDQATQSFIEPSRLQFEYTSLDLRSPENARFRYQLEGYDPGWIEAGTQRQVTYGTLPPGRYRFRVIGAGSEGVWNETGASFAFQIVPVFWRTWWFRATLVGLASLIAIGLYRLRVRQLRRQFSNMLEARVGERTRIARELHDTLLQTVQGSKLVADHALREAADHARMVRSMEQLSVWLAQATAEMRAALNSLRASSTDINSLADALRRAIEECRARSRADISLAVSGDPRELSPTVHDEVYRIAYEAIRNACAHSGAEHIEVSLGYGDDLTLRIRDDGSGIDPHLLQAGREGHFGLPGMRERAERIGGTLTVAGASGSGTVVMLVVPGVRGQT